MFIVEIVSTRLTSNRQFGSMLKSVMHHLSEFTVFFLLGTMQVSLTDFVHQLLFYSLSCLEKEVVGYL